MVTGSLEEMKATKRAVFESKGSRFADSGRVKSDTKGMVAGFVLDPEAGAGNKDRGQSRVSFAVSSSGAEREPFWMERREK